MECYHVPDEKIAVIPNGVNLKNFKPDRRKRLEIRQKYNIGEDEIVLIFVGHEFKRKGLTHIIKALPLVEAKLIIIGRKKLDPYSYRLLVKNSKLIDKIIFAGIVPKVEDYYAASDILVFPTMYEAFPLVPLEAAASGLPILATKVNGTEELIRDGYNGFFIKRNPLDIAEKIRILSEDKKLLKNMGRNARKTAEKYSWDKIAERTIKVYEELF
jgi:UDP-glucose:(heptosyl)LPS alpha-1,3-glucosyltransferase